MSTVHAGIAVWLDLAHLLNEERCPFGRKIAENRIMLSVFSRLLRDRITPLVESTGHGQWLGACAVPLAMQVRLSEYQPRNPADSLLHSVVAAELETFLADQPCQCRDPSRTAGPAAELQPDYNQVGADRVAFNDDCACGASVAWRRGRGAAELR